jgi:hypothetical protein
MKTGMELPLLGMVVVVLVMALWQAWSGMQVDLSVGALNATIAGQATPEPLLIVTQWLATAAGVILLLALLAGGVYAFRLWWQQRARQEKKAWKSGPNANWAQPPQPRTPSEAELMRMALLQQMSGGARYGERASPIRPTIIREGGNDEPEITF